MTIRESHALSAKPPRHVSTPRLGRELRHAMWERHCRFGRKAGIWLMMPPRWLTRRPHTRCGAASRVGRRTVVWCRRTSWSEAEPLRRSLQPCGKSFCFCPFCGTGQRTSQASVVAQANGACGSSDGRDASPDKTRRHARQTNADLLAIRWGGRLPPGVACALRRSRYAHGHDVLCSHADGRP